MATKLPEATASPFVRSGVNGMLIPLLPHQGGILHRYGQPENRLVIAATSEPEAEAPQLVIPSEPDPALAETQAANQKLQALVQAQAEQLRAFQEQMAQMQQMVQAQQTSQAPQAPKPRARAAKPAPVPTPEAVEPSVDSAEPLAPPVL
jgi:cell division protein FtsN